jgi:uncharacterized protein
MNTSVLWRRLDQPGHESALLNEGAAGAVIEDLSFSPATNLLPIRRTQLAVGAQASVRAAWVRFPAVTLKSLDQTYERVSESRYRYESGGGSFVAMLETNAVGFVTLYPGLWQLEEAG